MKVYSILILLKWNNFLNLDVQQRGNLVLNLLLAINLFVYFLLIFALTPFCVSRKFFNLTLILFIRRFAHPKAGPAPPAGSENF